MKVYEAIPESIAIELWLNGDELNELHFLDFIPKIGKNPREEKTIWWRKREFGRNNDRHGRRHKLAYCGQGESFQWNNIVKDRLDGESGKYCWGIKPPKMNNNLRRAINEEIIAYFNGE